MAARREFNGVPLRTDDAYQAYKSMTGDSFAGPDDIRLKQLYKAAESKNKFLRDKLEGAPNIDGDISGRTKTPFSIFGKLREAPGTEIDHIKDLSESMGKHERKHEDTQVIQDLFKCLLSH